MVSEILALKFRSLEMPKFSCKKLLQRDQESSDGSRDKASI